MPNRYVAVSRHTGKPLYDFATCVVHRVGDTVAAHPFQLALAILSVRPHLPVANWLDGRRFWEDWERAGFPGLRGSTTTRAGSGVWCSSPRRYLPGGSDPEDYETYEWAHWVALKPFRRWLLRRYPTLLEPTGIVQQRRNRLLRGDL